MSGDSGPRRIERAYLGVGVGTYLDASLDPLPQAIVDASAIGGVLGDRRYAIQVVHDPSASDIVPHGLSKMIPPDGQEVGGSLIVLWSGHGEQGPDSSLTLITSDGQPGIQPVVTAADIAGAAARSGATQILLIFDTCYSGGAVRDTLDISKAVLDHLGADPSVTWIGVLTSTLPLQLARDGQFGTRLVKLLRDGPSNPVWAQRWSAHSEGVFGTDIGHALLSEWNGDHQRPRFRQDGEPLVMIPNPRYDPAAADEIVEHLLLAARGADPGEEAFYFTGRTRPIGQVVDWIEREERGLCVVTGPAGSGKSAIVGRIVSVADAGERGRILEAGDLGHADPGPGSVQAHVHARGLTARRFVEVLDQQLSNAGMLPVLDHGPRTLDDLVDALEQAAAATVVVDGLDEAGSNAWQIASDMAQLRMAGVRFLVGTRDMARGSITLIDALDPTELVDLGGADLADDTAADLRRYVALRLARDDATARIDADATAEALLHATEAANEGPFLLARIVTAQLREHPIDTAIPGWIEQLSLSVETALETDLARTSVRMRDGRELPHAARDLLTALAWSYGSGLPDYVWPEVASAVTTSGTRYDRDDVYWLLENAGRYIVESGEGGRAAYRLSHQLLVQFLLPSRRIDLVPEAAARIAEALARRYAELLEAGMGHREPAYLWRHAWRHAADGGDRGIAAFRDLVATDPETFLPDLGMAAIELSGHYNDVGRHLDALPWAVEAVEIYRQVVTNRPGAVTDLAGALNNVGIGYGEVGRPLDALPPAEEAVEIYRRLAEDKPSLLPDLAAALNNLGVRYSGVGRHHDALPPTLEAVEIYRQLADQDPALLSYLARALNNLSVRYGELGRHADALPPTEEAVEIYRQLAGDSPEAASLLAGTLNNLGIHYSKLERSADALPPTEEAVATYRRLADDNPVFLLDLARALNNLGVRYSHVDRYADALAPTTEAVEIYRQLAEDNPGVIPKLAGALINLGIRLMNVGRAQDALSPNEEAVAITRELVQANPAALPRLASALSYLGSGYSSLERYQEALPLIEEAIAIYQDLANANSAFLPNLAFALRNLYQLDRQLDRSIGFDDRLAETARALDEESRAALLAIFKNDA